jgi:prepilin-type N-terminal cleavage/methylation domain-containing protein
MEGCEMKTQKRGFSLIELMIAIFIISCVLLLMIGLFTLLFSTSKKGVDMTAGIAAAEKIMEEYLYANDGAIKLLSFSLDSSGMGAPPKASSGTDSVNGVTFFYVIYVSRAKDVNTPKLRQVEETIYWWVNPADAATTNQTNVKAMARNYGMAKAKITRLIWLEGAGY